MAEIKQCIDCNNLAFGKSLRCLDCMDIKAHKNRREYLDRKKQAKKNG